MRVAIGADGVLLGYADVDDGGADRTRFWIDLRLLPWRIARSRRRAARRWSGASAERAARDALAARVPDRGRRRDARALRAPRLPARPAVSADGACSPTSRRSRWPEIRSGRATGGCRSDADAAVERPRRMLDRNQWESAAPRRRRTEDLCSGSIADGRRRDRRRVPLPSARSRRLRTRAASQRSASAAPWRRRGLASALAPPLVRGAQTQAAGAGWRLGVDAENTDRRRPRLRARGHAHRAHATTCSTKPLG